MRRWIGVLLAAGITAGVIALPSAAVHVQTLSIVGSDRIELPSATGGDNDLVHFAWDPQPADYFDGDSLQVCWNGRFDRTQLTSNRETSEICSSGRPGSQAGVVEGKSVGSYNTLLAGHYEAYVKRISACQDNCYPPPPRDISATNVVSFDVVDPCRLRLEGFSGKAPEYLPMVIGQPVTCSIGVSRDLRVRGDDGSTISLTSSRLSSIHYDTFELPWAPMLQIGSRGADSDVKFSLKNRLSHFAIAHTGGAMLIAVSPASASIVHRGNVSRVRVTSGRVVAFGMGSDFIQRSDLVPYCGRARPTIKCLSRIRYRYFTMKRGTSLRARVLRAGQKATFRKPPSVVTILH